MDRWIMRKKEAGPEGGKQLVWVLLLFIGFSKDITISRLPGRPGLHKAQRGGARREEGAAILGLRGPSG